MTVQEWLIPLREEHYEQWGKVLTHGRRPDPKSPNGKTYWYSIDGKPGLSKMPKTELPLYAWERLNEDGQTYVVITEGEKDADAVLARKYVAVGTATGASGTSIPCDVSLKVVLGRTVYLWADNDKAGRKHMDAIADRLFKLGATDVRDIRWDEAPKKGGAADFAGDYRAFIELIESATPRERPDGDLAENPSGFTLMNFVEFLDKPDGELDWLVDGWMAVGGTSTVVAKPKVGKSTFARNLSLSVARGSDFLGRRTEQGPVIYLALEETERRVREQFRRIGATGEEPIYIYVGPTPAQLFDDILPHMKSIQPKLLVLDPLFRAVRVKDSSAYAEVTNALDPILRLAASTGCHVLVPHHAGKQARETVDSALGSTAIAGTFDSIFVLRKNDGVRTIEVELREGDPIPKTVLSMDAETERISLAGSVEELTSTKIRGEILELVGDSWLERVEIEEAVEGSTRAIRSALKELVTENKVTREGSGKRGNPYVYSEYLFSCSTPYVGTREQETSELGTPHQVEIVSQRPEQETLDFYEPVTVDHATYH
jgi:hypothetical protein